MNPNSLPAIAPEILADLAPVRRLARPWKRTLLVCALGAVVALAVSVRLGVRADAAALGDTVLWGLSALQVCYGVALIALALRTAVPGRDLRRRAATLLLLAGAGVVVTITFVTWSAHPSHVPAGMDARYWTVCFRTPLVVGLPALLLTLLLAFRAYPTTPLLTGALAGLGAGLLSDGSWRTYCEVSDPVHVLTSHAASVVLLTLAGMALARLAATLSRRGLR
jgi:hypothetical protein